MEGKVDTDKLFPTDLPEREWVEFAAQGFSQPVTGVIYRRDCIVASGMPLGGVDTGCIDLETSGLLGYYTIFNSHIPRGGPINLPFLGMSLGGRTWVFAIKRTKLDESASVDPTTGKAKPAPWVKENYAPPDLTLEGVETVNEIHYWGHYPVADLEYELDAPISVGLRAWAPFLPGDIQSSLLPGAVFEVHLRNPSDTPQQGTLAFSFPGPNEVEAGGKWFERTRVIGRFNGVTVSARYSSYALGVVDEREIRVGGALGNDGLAWVEVAKALPVATADQPGASIAVDFALAPGAVRVVRFVLAWHSPKWKGSGTLAPVNEAYVAGQRDRMPASSNYYTHMYAKRYESAWRAAEILASNHEDLLKRVLAWQEVI